MHHHLFYRLALIAALLCISPAIYGFWNSAEVHHLAAVKRNYIPQFYHSHLRRATEPEFEGEEDVPGNLGPCVPRCVLTDAARSADGTKAKRSNDLSDTSCPGRSSSCLKFRDTSDNSTNRLQKRAQPLPGFGTNDDLRTKTQQELGDWMMQRMPRGGAPDVQMLWDENDSGQMIDLKAPKPMERWVKPLAIPTSLFQQPGNDAFAWGTIGLVGCTMYIIVKEPTQQDPSSGVYMAHIWEAPGFSNLVEDTITWMYAQKGAYIKDFISKGFPQANYGRWAAPEFRGHPTVFQEGLNNHGAHLGNGYALVMHPRTYDLEVVDGVEQYVEGEGPQYPDGLDLLKTTVDNVMRSKHKSTVNWFEDYLYLPAREDEEHTRAWTTPNSRSLFEYDPHFNLGNGHTTRMGMLLLEDGGPQGPLKPDGTYEPGPGGPFFFDFGS